MIEVVRLISVFRNTDVVHSSQQNISMTLCVTILLVKVKSIEVYVQYVRKHICRAFDTKVSDEYQIICRHSENGEMKHKPHFSLQLSL